MQFERLVIQAGANTFAVDFHPCLTVVAGLGAAERASLTTELLGALTSSRSGVHLELSDDDGRRLAVFRPHGRAHRVIDVDAATDVSAGFRNDRGDVDLTVHADIDPDELRRTMRVTAEDLVVGANGDDRVRLLAAIDADVLWARAGQVRDAEQHLRAVAESVGSAPEDAAIVEEVERRQAELEVARSRHVRTTRRAAVAAAAAGLAGIPLLFVVGPVISIAAAALASVMVGVAVVTGRRVQQAQGAAQDALLQAGVQSYLGFQLQRVDGMLGGSGGEPRSQLGEAAAANRRALDAWHGLAGEISADWVFEHRDEIEAAGRVRSNLNAIGAVASEQARLDEAGTADLARVLANRLAAVRGLGDNGETFPLVLDEPFHGVGPSVKPALLELLGHAGGHPQLILLTDDEDVSSWARLEALTGALTVLETASAPG